MIVAPGGSGCGIQRFQPCSGLVDGEGQGFLELLLAWDRVGIFRVERPWFSLLRFSFVFLWCGAFRVGSRRLHGVEGGNSLAGVNSSREMGACAALGSTNSWSDTGCAQGPAWRRSSKGGVSGPAEDLRPVSEVEAGGNFSAGRRCTGSLPGRQPGAGTRQQRVGVDTPSLHLEVPDIEYVSPGRGLEIR